MLGDDKGRLILNVCVNISFSLTSQAAEVASDRFILTY